MKNFLRWIAKNLYSTKLIIKKLSLIIVFVEEKWEI